jgi:hypothetical protein
LEKTYDNVLYCESGQSIHLSADDMIEYLISIINQFRDERDNLKKQLDGIRLILEPEVITH